MEGQIPDVLDLDELRAQAVEILFANPGISNEQLVLMIYEPIDTVICKFDARCRLLPCPSLFSFCTFSL